MTSEDKKYFSEKKQSKLIPLCEIIAGLITSIPFIVMYVVK